jgi:aspartyl-tRNA(Asn)/glutamyl-tRNA(Gln) amidotransferase subunit A
VLETLLEEKWGGPLLSQAPDLRQLSGAETTSGAK